MHFLYVVSFVDWALSILRGHSGHVTCLLYPHDENPRYNKTYLISGGSDFTVRAWDLTAGTLLHTFSCHGGEVLRLLVTPQECNVSAFFIVTNVSHRKIPVLELYDKFFKKYFYENLFFSSSNNLKLTLVERNKKAGRNTLFRCFYHLMGISIPLRTIKTIFATFEKKCLHSMLVL